MCAVPGASNHRDAPRPSAVQVLVCPLSRSSITETLDSTVVNPAVTRAQLTSPAFVLTAAAVLPAFIRSNINTNKEVNCINPLKRVSILLPTK